MIAMGIQCDFKAIILHGIDFMGEHFFQTSDTKYSAPFNFGRLDCPDGKLDDNLVTNSTFIDKDLECAYYFSCNIVPDGIILRALFMLAAERGIEIKSHVPSVSTGILR